ncbi:MAG TPA: DUF2946 family protein [Pirellulales bacterium]|nr:DUF2946 family protein [Pirellulales bacterium]
MNRRLATLVLLATYGSVALFGPELHELMGCHHHHQQASAWRASAIGSTAEASVEDRHDEAGHDHSTCPLCKLLSMAQSAGVAFYPGWITAITLNYSAHFCGAPAAAPLSSCRIRAPPASRGIVLSPCS